MAHGECCYLHLVTDAYSHKVVGWSLSPTLQAKYTLQALKEAINQAQGCDLSQLIHHSDRGVQYCCNDYINELNRYHINISMTEDYKPTDNGIAEIVNGIIKTEKLYRQPLYNSIKEAREAIGRFIDFYNNRRPHEHQLPDSITSSYSVRTSKKEMERLLSFNVYFFRTMTTF